MSQCNKLNGEWDFIVFQGKCSVLCLTSGQIIQLLWMKVRCLLIGSNENASCRRLCHKSGSVEIWDMQVWFGRGICSISLRIVYLNQSCGKTQPCGKRMTHWLSY